VEKENISINKDFLAAMSILENDMATTARNDINVEVKTSKKDFGTWYLEDSSRVAELKKVRKPKDYKTPKQFETAKINFMKGELSVLGAIPSFEKKDEYVDEFKNATGVNPIAAGKGRGRIKGLEDYFDEYKNSEDADFRAKVDSDVAGGDKKSVMVSWKHLENIKDVEELIKEPALKAQIVDILNNSVKAVAWKDKLTEFFQNNEGMKKWMVYEAASGYYKFKGSARTDTSKYKTGFNGVANKIVSFSDKGVTKTYDDLYSFAAKNIDLIDTLSVSYKGSARSRYMKLGLSSEYVPTGADLIQESIDEEIKLLYLQEGMFRDLGLKLKNKVTSMITTAKNVLNVFYERVIKRLFTKLVELGKQGIDAVLESLGISVEGEVSMKTPSW
jgi:hypothetical protein